MSGKKVLVIGDIVADVYVDGRISRISREAPVLILEKAGEKVVAGGAANVVANAATLGAEVYAVGVIGDDMHAESLRNIFKELDVHIEGLVRDKSRPTIAKTRIIAGGRATVSQQIVRIDEESKEPLS
ncbi:MAG: carbohydrate kinase, partial [Selenomonadaceae bacterium]|nr:carbohydrate kinase [Selenomonadaceae bacterium]